MIDVRTIGRPGALLAMRVDAAPPPDVGDAPAAHDDPARPSPARFRAGESEASFRPRRDAPSAVSATEAETSRTSSRVRDDEAIVRAFASLSASLVSPEALVASLESIATAEAGRGLRVGAEDALHEQRAADRTRAKARSEAAKAARRARRALSRAPKWVRKLLKAVIVVASAVASVFTGGVAGALAIAGLALALAAPMLEKLAVALGADPATARWVGLACRVVGAALAAGSGAAGAAAGSSATVAQVGHVASVVQKVVSGASAVVSGTKEVVGASFTRTAASALDDAGRAEVAERHAAAAVVELAHRMRELAAHLERVAKVAADTLAVRDSTRHALASAYG